MSRPASRPPYVRAAPGRLAVAALALGCSALAACGGLARTPDDAYGHRYGGVAPDGRETVMLDPADSTADSIVQPAALDSVAVRPAVAAAPAGTPVAVEVLVKGTLPDACTVLDRAAQTRVGHLVAVTLTMRQPRGALCAQVVRPFRFYLPLEGTFEPGHYSLTVNGASYPFRIREAAAADGE